MTWFARKLSDPFADCAALERRRHGVIEVRNGQLAAIHLRVLPKVISALEVELIGKRWHAGRPGDCCFIYYNQPRRLPNFLALKYIVSLRDCTLATFNRALEVLDEVARVKHTDAIVADVWNERISERLLKRWGWEPHRPARWHRNYIKRFYGVYPVYQDDVRWCAGTPLAVMGANSDATRKQGTPAGC